MKRQPKRSQRQPRPAKADCDTNRVEPSQQEARKAGAINVRDFILSGPPPPAIFAEALLAEVKDVLTPEQAREFILQHQFPPVWGEEMEGRFGVA